MIAFKEYVRTVDRVYLDGEPTNIMRLPGNPVRLVGPFGDLDITQEIDDNDIEEWVREQHEEVPKEFRRRPSNRYC